MKIKISDIEVSDIFNCRGPIAPMDVTSTAKSLEEHGLIQPIVVRLMPQSWQEHTLKKYSLVCGFRRLTAADKILKWPEIEATVHENMTDEQARIINFAENLERKDLSLMQEANAVMALKTYGLNRDGIAAKLNKSPAWVQLREQASYMPPEIQKALDKGELTQRDLRELYVLRDDPQQQMERAKKLRAKNMKELDKDEVKDILKTEKKTKNNIKRIRSPGEIEIMQDVIRELKGNGLETRLLGWCAGYVSDVEIHMDLKDKFPGHQIPEEIINAEYVA